PGLLVMVHELPEGMGVQVTAINFSAAPVDEVVRLKHVPPGQAIDMFTEEAEGEPDADGSLCIRLDGYSGKSYLIAPATAS
ncbi:MAG: maltose alpha-D-glucosyltransferase, partial [Anaerolinea sp.]|nr:maltose alpha-D-glucosyltransferase [Anaerolinea sp.]